MTLLCQVKLALNALRYTVADPWVLPGVLYTAQQHRSVKFCVSQIHMRLDNRPNQLPQVVFINGCMVQCEDSNTRADFWETVCGITVSVIIHHAQAGLVGHMHLRKGLLKGSCMQAQQMQLRKRRMPAGSAEQEVQSSFVQTGYGFGYCSRTIT